MFKTGPFRRRTNALFLIGSFALGHGSLFLAQSWLLVRGELSFIGLFGASFALVTLGVLLADWGGLVLLARHELARPSDEEASQHFWNLTAVRLVVSLAAAASIGAWALSVGSGFPAAYATTGMLSFIFAAVNPGGILDGLHRSGANGPTTMLPILLSALTLPGVAGWGPEAQGYALGAAYSLGVGVGVLLQHIMVAREGRHLLLARPTGAGLREAARDGGLLLMSILPGQLFYRGQLAISVWLLGTAGTGLFVYAKQILNAALQLAQFVRRAEFPGLVTIARDDAHWRAVMGAQRGSLRGSIVLALLMIGGGFGANLLGSSAEVVQAGKLLAAFGPSVVAVGLFMSMTQAFAAAGRLAWPATVMNMVVLLGLVLSVPGALWLNAYGFALSEFLVNVAGFLTLVALWKRRGGSARDLPFIAAQGLAAGDHDRHARHEGNSPAWEKQG